MKVYKKLLSWVLGVFIFVPLTGIGDVAPETALSVVKTFKKKNEGWEDSQATVEMLLISKSGEKAKRLMDIQVLEVSDDGDKSLTVFQVPKDIKGTAFLSHSHPLSSDEQWMYLPAIKRVKRIASRNKSGPFMGSEFAFEDMSSFEIEKYRYGDLTYNEINDDPVFVVEAFPLDEFSGYSKQEFWIDKDQYRMRKIVYFNQRNEPFKTLRLEDYRLYMDRFWRAGTSIMSNHQSGRSTVLSVLDMKIGVGLRAVDFSRSALRRAR